MRTEGLMKQPGSSHPAITKRHPAISPGMNVTPPNPNSIPKAAGLATNGPLRPAAPPVYRGPAAASQMRPVAGNTAPRQPAPPVYRPAATAPQAKPNGLGTAPPVYRPAAPLIASRPAVPTRTGVVSQARFAPRGAGAVQRKITPEIADGIVRGNPMKVNDLKDYIDDLLHQGKLPKEYDYTQEEELMIGKALIKVGLQTPKKKEADDITIDFKPSYACVLQTVIYIKGTVFGKSSPKDLHDLIWSDKSKTQFRQYDDDSVTPDFYRAAGLTPKPFAADAVMATLPDTLPIGKYAVGVKGTVENHMYILDKTAKEANWKEFDQLGGRGFQDARVNKNGKIDSVYG